MTKYPFTVYVEGTTKKERFRAMTLHGVGRGIAFLIDNGFLDG